MKASNMLSEKTWLLRGQQLSNSMVEVSIRYSYLTETTTRLSSPPPPTTTTNNQHLKDDFDNRSYYIPTVREGFIEL